MIILNIYKYILLFFIILFELVILYFAIKSGKFLKAILINSLIGILTIIFINISSKYIGVVIPINIFTVLSGAFYGLPGVCTILVSQVLLL